MDLSLRSQTQICLGIFERETHPWLRRLSRGIHTAVDIGAAHGEHTLFFLTKTQASKVYAFEPDTTLAGNFQSNLNLNGLTSGGKLELSSKMVGSQDNEKEATLDSLEGSIHLPCLIKLDVDGGEVKVLNGASRLNARPGVRWLIETHSESLETSCIRILSAAGFHTRVVPNAWWRVLVPELRPLEQNRWLVAWNDTLAA